MDIMKKEDETIYEDDYSIDFDYSFQSSLGPMDY